MKSFFIITIVICLVSCNYVDTNTTLKVDTETENQTLDDDIVQVSKCPNIKADAGLLELPVQVEKMPDCYKGWDPDSKKYDYGTSYPDGSYGFKGSICRNENHDKGFTDLGDTIHNICLPNYLGETICLNDIANDPKCDFLAVDFSATWCKPCNWAAAGESKFLTYMRHKGWNFCWVTIIDQAAGVATEADAYIWKEKYHLQGEVLYNTYAKFRVQWIDDKWPNDYRRGYPTVFIVNAENMLIWEALVGWANPDDGYYYGYMEYIDNLMEFVNFYSKAHN